VAEIRYRWSDASNCYRKDLKRVTECANSGIVLRTCAVRPDVKSGSRPTRRDSEIPMAWVYILKTGSGKYYIGSTITLSERMRHHFGGHTISTRKMVPAVLLLSQEYKTLQEARSVEAKIKKLKRKDYVEKIIKDGYIRVQP